MVAPETQMKQQGGKGRGEEKKKEKGEKRGARMCRLN
jgi:hypothetical protein